MKNERSIEKKKKRFLPQRKQQSEMRAFIDKYYVVFEVMNKGNSGKSPQITMSSC